MGVDTLPETLSKLAFARESADRLAAMQQAAQQVPELEREAQRQQQIAEARQRAGELAGRLDSALAAYQAQKQQADRRLAEVVHQLAGLVNERRALKGQADQVHQLAAALGHARLQAAESELLQVGRSIGAKFAVKGAAEQELLDRGVAYAKLNVIAQPADDLEARILLALARILGVVVEKRMEPTAIRVVRTDPATGEQVEHWE